jgi:hypothetical protein
MRFILILESVEFTSNILLKIVVDELGYVLVIMRPASFTCDGFPLATITVSAGWK